ncbi:uncharacterized protein (TIGR02588 family) [Bradyrhizobium sp. LB8.2]|jgi:uncharacterized protein (TIGR02588 family)
MPLSEWTRMAIASAVAVIAMSYLAIDAGVVSSSGITKRIETARASIAGTAVSQYQLAFAVQAWAGRGHQKPALEACLATD